MRLSYSRSRESIWVWLFWGLSIYLALEVVSFSIIGLALDKSPRDLVGPFVAFALPWTFMAPQIWWLRKWEEAGLPPARLALRWGFSMALFGEGCIAATYYSGVRFRLMEPKDAVVNLVVAVLFSSPIFFFGMWRSALRTLTEREARKMRSAGPSNDR